MHWACSYEHVAMRVSGAVPSEYRSISTATFHKITRAITKAVQDTDCTSYAISLTGEMWHQYGVHLWTKIDF